MQDIIKNMSKISASDQTYGQMGLFNPKVGKNKPISYIANLNVWLPLTPQGKHRYSPFRRFVQPFLYTHKRPDGDCPHQVFLLLY